MTAALHIGFDAKRAFSNQTGLGVYSRSLIADLYANYPENKYWLFAPKKTNLFSIQPGMEFVSPEFPIAPFWRQLGIASAIKKNKIDLFHGLSNEIPLMKTKGVRYVCTIHDLIWLKFPHLYKPHDRFFYTQKLKHACRVADLIIATSFQTATDLMDMMQVAPQKIKVVYQSGPPKLSDYPTAAPIDSPYLFYLSSFETRKNHALLIKSFANLKNTRGVKLVLAGKKSQGLSDLQHLAQSLKVKEKVVFLSDISESEKQIWLKHALAFVYPSQYEGFGIPLLEAIHHGSKLLLSNLPVFKEIAGDNALYFSAQSEEEWTHALQIAIDTPMQLISYSVEDAASRFLPASTAAALMEAYGACL